MRISGHAEWSPRQIEDSLELMREAYSTTNLYCARKYDSLMKANCSSFCTKVGIGKSVGWRRWLASMWRPSSEYALASSGSHHCQRATGRRSPCAGRKPLSQTMSVFSVCFCLFCVMFVHV